MKSEYQSLEKNTPNNQSNPFVAVVFHKSSEQVVGATRHEIKNGQMQSGSYVTPEEVSELFLTQTAKEHATCASLIPANILVDNSRFLIWHKPSIERMMWYRVNSNVENFPVKWPPLLFIASELPRDFATLRSRGFYNLD